MGRRDLDKLLLDWIIESGCESVTFVGANDREHLVRKVAGVGIDVDFVDSDPKFGNPRDAIFDDVAFKELVVAFNAEKHFPIGRKRRGELICVGDNDRHNGDCNPIEKCETMIFQNKMNTLFRETKIGKWFVVWGTNAD